jgi:autotransporter-associated beta strand protein
MKPKATLSHFLALALAGSSLLAVSSHAATRTWGGGDLDWTNTSTSGWNGSVPTTSATINSGTVTVTTNISGGNTPGTINLTGGMLVISTGKLVGGNWTPSKTLTLGSGTTLHLNSWGWDVAGSLGGLDYGRDRLVVNGGIIEVTGNSSESGRIFTVGTGGATLRSSVNSGQTWTLQRDSNSLYHDIQVNSGRTLTLDGTGNGVIENTIVNTSGTGNITKAGAGTWTLTNTNTYSGGTTVSQGTLAVTGTGSINGTSGVSITGGELNYGSSVGLTKNVTVDGGTFRYNSSTAYTGTLSYTSGTLAGTNLTGASFGTQVINADKTISPGNSPGTMSVGSQEWSTDGSYLWEVNNATGTAGANPGWDLLSGTGTLNITSTITDPFVILVTSLQLDNNAGLAANFLDTSSYSWLIADFDEITGFAPNLFSIDTTNFDNPFTGTFGLTMLDNGGTTATRDGLYLTYTAIPEPSAALLGGLGILLIFRRRR